MTYRVFSQEATLAVPLSRLFEQARRHFALSLTLEEQRRDDTGQRLYFALSAGAGPRVWLRARQIRSEDLGAADRAESRGRAAGMAALARRCRSLWEVEAEAGLDTALFHEFCALLASVALGPVLPPDESTLYGVRGAMERAAAS